MIRSVNKISSFSTQPTGSITAGSWTDYVKRFAAALLNNNSQNDLTTLNQIWVGIFGDSFTSSKSIVITSESDRFIRRVTWILICK